MKISRLLACLLVLVAAAGCDDGFTPITPTDLRFSIFGYLDASADTQWVRVMPIRPTTLTEPGPLGATVTLENVETGQVIEMRDSVFRFLGNPDVGAEGAYLHNFWTTERIEPRATYRFSAKQEGGKAAEAVVAIPPDYGVEVWITQSPNGRNILRLAGLSHTAFVETVTYLFDRCGLGVQHVSVQIDPADSDTQMISLPRLNTFRPGCGIPAIDSRDLSIVGSGAEWPRGRGFTPGRLSDTDTMSNVSNSVGYLGGVLTKLVPYESCRIVNGDPSEYCRLHYDAAVATLSGKVTDATCTDAAIVGATVELRELDPVLPAKPKIRFTDTGHAGTYTISALEAGGRYALTISRFIRGNLYDQFEDHTDTLVFAPGEHRTYDVGLRALTCPP